MPQVQLDLTLSRPYCYVIDASSLIDLKKHYPREMKTFEPIWIRLEQLISEKRLISHSEVYSEIEEKDDELFKWCKRNKKMFKDEYDFSLLSKVQTFYDRKYWENNVSDTKPWADPWIIVLAIKTKAKIVTQENKKKQNRIPTVAQNFEIVSLNLIEFFKDIGIP
ncbi:MAG: DUF4411 family protein [Archaeoglobaceae archaeon]